MGTQTQPISGTAGKTSLGVPQTDRTKGDFDTVAEGSKPVNADSSKISEQPKRKFLDFSQPWNKLTGSEKSERFLDSSFAFLVAPLCGLSFVSSAASFITTNFLNSENETIDSISGLINKGAYFCNGVYGSLDSALSDDLVGTVGYGLVSMASVVGNNENMYQWKAPGSATDQLPGLNDCTATNKKIMKEYELKPGQEKYFKVYSNYMNSVKKTFSSFKVVCSDIVDEFKTNCREEGKNIFKSFIEIFVTSKRRAERHLVISSLGIYTGFVTGIGLGLKKLGATIRDLNGILADIGVLGIAFSPQSEVGEEKEETKSRVKYGFSGASYLTGGIVDLLHWWTKVPKTDLLAVGADNVGFGFMTWASADSHRQARELKRKLEKEKELQLGQAA